MKIMFIFFFLFTVPCAISAQIVNIPDPVFKQRLIDEGVDTNDDNEIQVTEAEAVNSSLVVTGDFEDIFDLTGIEAFKNITELYCQLNQLTTLDLSQNTALVHLECWDNPLTSLNISQCISLTFLEAERTELTSLDLTNNVNLIHFIVSDGQLTELNLTQNNKLESIGFENINTLSSVDIRNSNNINITSFGSQNNPNLTCIFVDDAEYMESTFGGNIDQNTHFVETQSQCDALSIKSYQTPEIKIYPNPTKHILQIEGLNISNPNTEIFIYDSFGRKLIQTKIFSKNPRIDLGSLHRGVYLLTIFNNINEALTTKIFKL